MHLSGQDYSLYSFYHLFIYMPFLELRFWEIAESPGCRTFARQFLREQLQKKNKALGMICKLYSNSQSSFKPLINSPSGFRIILSPQDISKWIWYIRTTPWNLEVETQWKAVFISIKQGCQVRPFYFLPPILSIILSNFMAGSEFSLVSTKKEGQHLPQELLERVKHKGICIQETPAASQLQSL